MEFEGFVIHHSACEQDHNKERWDFTVQRDGSVSVSPVLKHSEQIHICLEGDFNRDYDAMNIEQKMQLFTACKIISDLSRLYSISPLYLFPHSETCPGAYFPWNALVIYPVDGYH
ncbi:N-acetylmuramoyl-L-alanine amidase [Paenibacillus sp. N3/727]|uniref:N-acetylmuramoyl-L-alanine amidase n=1 Tax=Paenibacillus sp. N3/727 TaxID=2925845 RepID=UPI001F53375E|nr:N-acetylmuramoyl-L-alanine amidase [Paenibacillus sp. N3/727]UNK20481.1 N-acetylmuramoyl-L-alanine amidase [Paenibacillus sp. N3/727]